MAELEQNTETANVQETTNEKTEPQNETRYRQLAFGQYEKNPKTGEDLKFNELNIIRAFSHRTINKYAYVLHNKDVKIAGDESHPDISVGDPIPNHWQGVVYCKNGVTISKLAEWLGIPEFLIKVLHGRDAFIDYVGYLPHDDTKQQALGKHLYADNEIKANFNWRTEVDIYRQRQKDNDLLYLDNKQYYRHKVLYDGLTLRQIAVENPDAYRTDFQTLEKYRLQYLLRFAELPLARINYYVTGRGGVGKGLISRAVARNLYPDLKNDDDIFFEVGGNNVAFEEYDGQPVIIWNDCRALTLLRSLGGRENVFNVFDTHPTNCRQNVKFGSIRLEPVKPTTEIETESKEDSPFELNEEAARAEVEKREHNTEEVSESVAEILKTSEAASDSLDNEFNQNQNMLNGMNTPFEVVDKNMISTINEEFRESVRDLIIPSFYIKKPQSIFNLQEEEWLTDEVLLEDFTLRNADTDIEFNATPEQIVSIDIEKGKKPQYLKMNADTSKQFKANFSNLPTDKKKEECKHFVKRK